MKNIDVPKWDTNELGEKAAQALSKLKSVKSPAKQTRKPKATLPKKLATASKAIKKKKDVVSPKKPKSPKQSPKSKTTPAEASPKTKSTKGAQTKKSSESIEKLKKAPPKAKTALKNGTVKKNAKVTVKAKPAAKKAIVKVTKKQTKKASNGVTTKTLSPTQNKSAKSSTSPTKKSQKSPVKSPAKLSPQVGQSPKAPAKTAKVVKKKPAQKKVKNKLKIKVDGILRKVAKPKSTKSSQDDENDNATNSNKENEAKSISNAINRPKSAKPKAQSNKSKSTSPLKPLAGSVTKVTKKRASIALKLKNAFQNIEAKELKTPSLHARMKDKLNSARFRYINEELYTKDSGDAVKLFREDPDAFTAYHEGYRQQVKKWPINPLTKIIESIKKMSDQLIIADFGCGDAELAKSVKQKVHSFDLVAANQDVIACDMSHVPLDNQSVDIVVFCLSLMGTNLHDYLIEANRILKTGGILKIAEVESRFEQVDTFIAGAKRFGFDNIFKDLSNKLFYFMDFKKARIIRGKKTLPTMSLKPCIYKRR